MSTLPIQIFRMIVAAFICGAVMGVFYDVLRLTRVFLGYHYISEKSVFLQNKCVKKFPIKSRETVQKRFYFKLILFVEDVIFVTVSAVVFVLILFYGNEGNFRFAAILAYVFGFIAYYFTLGKINVLFFDVWVIFLRTLLRYVLYYVFLPIRFAAEKIKLLLKKISCILIKIIENIKIKRYNKKEIEKAIRFSEKGMIDNITH